MWHYFACVEALPQNNLNNVAKAIYIYIKNIINEEFA
jgi:hypothetical protein